MKDGDVKVNAETIDSSLQAADAIWAEIAALGAEQGWHPAVAAIALAKGLGLLSQVCGDPGEERTETLHALVALVAAYAHHELDIPTIQ